MVNNENENIVAVIQARLCSTRLPCKMMLHLKGYPIIEWVVRRVKKSRRIHDMVVAIPDAKADDVLADHLRKMDVDVCRGSEKDVLNRLFNAAKAKNATLVVRICADNPLISAEEIDNLISFYKEYPCDYAYNHIPRNNVYPDGLGAEIVPFKVLRRLEEEVADLAHREHVLTYIWEHRKAFKVKTFDPPNPQIRHPELKLDIDTIGDYRKIALSKVSIDSTAEEIVKSFLTPAHENS